MTPRRHPKPAQTAGKLCLKCALRKLAGQPEKPCGTCLLLNVDPLALVRAKAARPFPVAFLPAR